MKKAALILASIILAGTAEAASLAGGAPSTNYDAYYTNGVLAAMDAEIRMRVTPNMSSAMFVITGDGILSGVAECSVDGSYWGVVAVSTVQDPIEYAQVLEPNADWRRTNIAGCRWVRIRVYAYTSGTAVGHISLSDASANDNATPIDPFMSSTGLTDSVFKVKMWPGWQSIPSDLSTSFCTSTETVVATATVAGTTKSILYVYNPTGSGKEMRVSKVQLSTVAGSGGDYVLRINRVSTPNPSPGGTAIIPSAHDLGYFASVSSVVAGATAAPLKLATYVTYAVAGGASSSFEWSVPDGMEPMLIMESSGVEVASTVTSTITTPAKVAATICWEEER